MAVIVTQTLFVNMFRNKTKWRGRVDYFQHNTNPSGLFLPCKKKKAFKNFDWLQPYHVGQALRQPHCIRAKFATPAKCGTGQVRIPLYQPATPLHVHHADL